MKHLLPVLSNGNIDLQYLSDFTESCSSSLLIIHIGKFVLKKLEVSIMDFYASTSSIRRYTLATSKLWDFEALGPAASRIIIRDLCYILSKSVGQVLVYCARRTPMPDLPLEYRVQSIVQSINLAEKASSKSGYGNEGRWISSYVLIVVYTRTR